MASCALLRGTMLVMTLLAPGTTGVSVDDQAYWTAIKQEAMRCDRRKLPWITTTVMTCQWHSVQLSSCLAKCACR